jgi:hypothetical protein
MTAFYYNSGAIALEIQAKVADISGNDLMPLVKRLDKRETSQTAIKWNTDVGGEAAIGESVNADAMTDSSAAAVIPLSLPIASNRFRHTFTVYTTEMAEAAAQGEGELANLLAYASKLAMRVCLRSLATEIYAGTGAEADGGVVGLSALHANVTSSLSTDDYANGDVSTYAKFSNYVNENDGTPRALTDDLMFKMSEEILGGGTLGVNSNFTAVYTTPALVTKYKTLFQSVSDFNLAPNGVADLGYSGLAFEGRPVLMDPRCTAGTMYFVDEDELALWTFAEGAKANGYETTEQSLNFKIVELATLNPDKVKFAVVLKPQLQIARRAAVAVLGDLS